MVRNNILLLLLVVVSTALFPRNYFLVYFKDKSDNPFALTKPEQFLSERSLARRVKEGVPLDISDLPVSPKYLDSLQGRGIQVIYTSKWLNAALVYEDSSTLEGFDFKLFDSYSFLGRRDYGAKFSEAHTLLKSTAFEPSYYGSSYNQLHMMNVDSLHREGYDGASVLIAVLDEGFENVDTIKAFKHLFAQGKILDVYNFVNENKDVYRLGEHGTKVLSCLAAKLEGALIGASYNAAYALYRTENSSSENPVEEFYYLLGAERADSLGVDILSSSLSYRDFDNSALDHSYEDLDGKTTLAARAVLMLARKGVIVVTSAGNTGAQSFRTVGTPADADSILTVGAVTTTYERSSFSSIGPTVDRRIKPDVSALGTSVLCLDRRGNVGVASGTSFATPLVAGFTALLKERYPSLSSQQLMAHVKSISTNASSPNNQIGYGVPRYGKSTVSNVADEELYGYFNNGFLYIHKEGGLLNLAEAKECRLYDVSGKLMLLTRTLEQQGSAVRTLAGNVSKGIYLGFVVVNGRTLRLKVIKTQ